MRTLKRCVWAFLVAMRLASWVGAQVPNELYMQGVFLEPDGATPVAGTHNVTVSIYTNSSTAALTLSTNLQANNRGVAELIISNAKLPDIFQGCTNATFHMSGSVTQSFVTAPYAFQAANLPAASGNFTIGGDLNVASNARLVALTATNGGTLSCPITVGQYAVFTNVSSVNFGSALDVAGGMSVGGTSEANYQVRFTNTAATAVVYGDTNSVVMSNAVVRAPFTLFSTNYARVSNSGTADSDGFLLVWTNVSDWDTDGVYVKIGNNTFLLRYYSNAGNGESLDFFTGNTFPVAQGTQWSATLANAGDSSHLSIICYWVPLKGNG